MRFDDCTMDHGRFIATTLESMMRCLWWRLIVKLASTLDPWWNCSKVVSCCHHVGSHVSRQADWLPASEEPSRQHWWRDMVIWPRHGFNALMLVKMDMCRTSAGEVCRLRWRLTISILLGLPGWPFAREKGLWNLEQSWRMRPFSNGGKQTGFGVSCLTVHEMQPSLIQALFAASRS